MSKQREALELARAATPHDQLITELLDSRIPKTEREHAAAREIKKLREALAEPEPALQWQPINFAPKDRAILTYGRLPGSYGYYDEEWCYSISKWAGNGWSSQRSMAYGSAFIPTHWMPLPEKPKGEV